MDPKVTQHQFPTYSAQQAQDLQQVHPSQRKTYYAYTVQDGMKKVERELGPQATILSTRAVPHPEEPSQKILEIIASVPQANQRPVASPEQTRQEVGGLETQMAKIREVVVMPLRYPEMFQRLGIDPPRGVLMFGPPGCGKTLIARALAKECGANFVTINGPELMGGNLGESEKNLRETFENAAKEQSAVIFFDEIDAIAGKRQDSQSGTERRIVTQLLTLMDGVDREKQLVVLAATNLPDEIDPALRRPGRFDREVEITAPDEKGRLEILRVHTRKMTLAPDVRLEKLAASTHGYVGADLANLCREAGLSALRDAFPSGIFPAPGQQANLTVGWSHFEQAMKDFRPSSLREHAAVRPDVTWDDIGGLLDVKQALNEAIVMPLKRPDMFKKMGIHMAKGVLLAGPPGTGKTLIARAAAAECGVNFICVNGPSLVSKYVGESEKAIRELFTQARQAQPCIIFFDEFDSVAPVRGGNTGESDHANRLVAQLLVEMDGFESAEGVFCLAATNRPDSIDPALLRPGRFDKVIEVPLPDEESRKKILQVHLQGKPMERNIDPDAVLAMTEGLSGAEIAEACRRAAITAVRKVLAGEGQLEPAISQRGLIEALQEVGMKEGKAMKAASNPRILLLDDDTRVLEYTSVALEMSDFEAISFEDPLKALAAIEAEHFDLAFLDINMPVMNGLEVLARIRSIQPNLPVVMLTGEPGVTLAVQSFRLGVVDYLQKPCKFEQIQEAARKAIDSSIHG